MFNRLEHDGQFLGLIYETERALFFFGSRLLGRDDLKKYFPELEFAFLKQVHGRTVLSGTASTLAEADGHFTDRPGLALVSQSADCIPLLLAGEGIVCALHAGWRGVAQNIVQAAKEVLLRKPTTALIGPHIRRKSFEVGTDVAKQLLSARAPSRTAESVVFEHNDSQKKWVDLNILIREQIKNAFPKAEIFDCGEDTHSSRDYHSFRRDKDQAGRQYSFVSLKR